MQRDVIEPIVGGLVLVVALGFAWFAYTTTGLTRHPGYEVAAQFDRIDGIAAGSDVRVSGIKVGAVTSLTLDPRTYMADVRFSVASAVKLPDDSVAQITSDGLLGSRFISILPGASDTMLKPGEKLKFTQAPVDVVQMLGKFMFSMGEQTQKDGAKDGAK